MRPAADAFTLIRHATGLLPAGARAANGATVGDVRDCERAQDWEFALDLLVEIADRQAAPARFWALLAEAARQVRLDRTAEWCAWREAESRHGMVRAELSLLPAAEGGRRTAFSGRGRLRPLWDIGNRAPDGGRAVHIAGLWVEGAPDLAPGGTTTVRLVPLRPEPWRGVRPGDVITMHEGAPAVGTAVVLEVARPAPAPGADGATG